MKARKLISLLSVVAMLSAMFVMPAHAATITTTEYGRIFDGTSADTDTFDFFTQTDKTVSWHTDTTYSGYTGYWGEKSEAGWDWSAISKADNMPEEFTLKTRMGISTNATCIYFNGDFSNTGATLKTTILNNGYKLYLANSNTAGEDKVILYRYKNGTEIKVGEYTTADHVPFEATVTKKKLDTGYEITFTGWGATYTFTDSDAPTVTGGKAGVGFNQQNPRLYSLQWSTETEAYPTIENRRQSYTFKEMTKDEVKANFTGHCVDTINETGYISTDAATEEDFIDYKTILAGDYSVTLDNVHFQNANWTEDKNYNIYFNMDDEMKNGYRLNLLSYKLYREENGSSTLINTFTDNTTNDFKIKVTSTPQDNGGLKITVSDSGGTQEYTDKSAKRTFGKVRVLLCGTTSGVKTFAVTHNDAVITAPAMRGVSYTFADMSQSNIEANFTGTNIDTIRENNIVSVPGSSSTAYNGYIAYNTVLAGDYTVEFTNMHIANPTWGAGGWCVQFNYDDLDGTGYKYYPLTKKLVRTDGTVLNEGITDGKNIWGVSTLRITSTPQPGGALKIVIYEKNDQWEDTFEVIDSAPISTLGNVRYDANGSADFKSSLKSFAVTYNDFVAEGRVSVASAELSGGVVSGKVNYTTDDTDYVVVVAVYDAIGLMLGAQVLDVNEDLNSVDFSMDMSNAKSTPVTCSAFLWGSLNEADAICDANSRSITER